jgi:hypothetical protein
MEKEPNACNFGEKRKHARINTSCDVTYILFDENKKKTGNGKGRTLNLSQSGTLLETKGPLQGSFIILATIDLEGKQVQLKGSIAHTSVSKKSGYHLTGIHFAGSTEKNTKAIVAFIKAYCRSKHAVKVYVKPDHTAEIQCPQCKKSKIQDVSRFKGHFYGRMICSCGNVSTLQFELCHQSPEFIL